MCKKHEFACADRLIKTYIRIIFAYYTERQAGRNIQYAHACADPGIFVRGVQVSLTKKALTTFFFFLFSPQLILQKSNGQFQRNLSFFKVPEGVQHFPGGGGVQLFPGGSNCLFPIENHITFDFPGGGLDPLSPLLIRTWHVQIDSRIETRG